MPTTAGRLPRHICDIPSNPVYTAMWFVFAADAGLAVVVDPKATPLVLFTVVLLLLTRVPSARRWFASPR